MSLAPDDPRHGKAGTYQRLRCRCEACREAQRMATRAWREANPTIRRAAHQQQNTVRQACVEYVREQHAEVYARFLDDARAARRAVSS